jgi:hypothetical protein
MKNLERLVGQRTMVLDATRVPSLSMVGDTTIGGGGVVGDATIGV